MCTLAKVPTNDAHCLAIMCGHAAGTQVQDHTHFCSGCYPKSFATCACRCGCLLVLLPERDFTKKASTPQRNGDHIVEKLGPASGALCVFVPATVHRHSAPSRFGGSAPPPPAGQQGPGHYLPFWRPVLEGGPGPCLSSAQHTVGTQASLRAHYALGEHKGRKALVLHVAHPLSLRQRGAGEATTVGHGALTSTQKPLGRILASDAARGGRRHTAHPNTNQPATVPPPSGEARGWRQRVGGTCSLKAVKKVTANMLELAAQLLALLSDLGKMSDC